MVEQVKYTLLKKIDTVELRHYPKIILASAPNQINDSGFSYLFQYISGNNRSQKKIPMTAPVITQEKIPMTAPVITKDGYMAFVLPQTYTKETIPQPLSPNVTIEVIPERDLAVLRFSGVARQKLVDEKTNDFIKILEKHQIQTKGTIFLMRYNSPFSPGFLRRNEIAIEITLSKD